MKTATPKEEAIEVEGTIGEPLPNAMFRVELTNVSSREIACSWSSRPTTSRTEA